MKVEDIVMVVDHQQELSIDVIMQDDIEGITQTYSMNWEGYAEDVPLNIMRTDIRGIRVDQYEDGDSRDRFHIISEM